MAGVTGASRVDCNHHPRTAREWSAAAHIGKLLAAAAAAAAASSWLSGAAPAIVSVVGPGRRWLWLGLGYGKLLAAAAAAAAASSWLSGGAAAAASVWRSNARAG